MAPGSMLGASLRLSTMFQHRSWQAGIGHGSRREKSWEWTGSLGQDLAPRISLGSMRATLATCTDYRTTEYGGTGYLT